MRRVRQDRRAVGAFANMSGMRRDVVLRQLTESTRQQTRTRDWTPRDCVRAARRTLAVLLSGRGVRPVLNLRGKPNPDNF